MFITGRPGVLLAGLAIAAVSALLIALVSGSANIGIAEIFGGDGGDEIIRNVLDLRLSRALTAFAIGGLLAVAGVLMQVLLRNPLAEPYILGTSGGAAVAALLAMILGMSSLIVDLAAFGGAMVVLYILKLRRRRVEVPFSPLWARVVWESSVISAKPSCVSNFNTRPKPQREESLLMGVQRFESAPRSILVKGAALARLPRDLAGY